MQAMHAPKGGTVVPLINVATPPNNATAGTLVKVDFF